MYIDALSLEFQYPISNERSRFHLILNTLFVLQIFDSQCVCVRGGGLHCELAIFTMRLHCCGMARRKHNKK